MGRTSIATLALLPGLLAGCGSVYGDSQAYAQPVGYGNGYGGGYAAPAAPGYAAQPAYAAPADGGITVSVFHDSLAPYGSWIDSSLGQVFVPAQNDYVPYSDGYWVYADHGFTWVSNEPIGWAVCHYGRWAQLEGRWVWVPDTQWGPAWVDWRDAGGHVGWAPRAPEGWATAVPSHLWLFVDVQYIFVQDIHVHVQTGWDAHGWYGNAAPIAYGAYTPGGVAYCPGPTRDSLRRRRVRVQVTRPSRAVARGPLSRHELREVAQAYSRRTRRDQRRAVMADVRRRQLVRAARPAVATSATNAARPWRGQAVQPQHTPRTVTLGAPQRPIVGSTHVTPQVGHRPQHVGVQRGNAAAEGRRRAEARLEVAEEERLRRMAHEDARRLQEERLHRQQLREQQRPRQVELQRHRQLEQQQRIQQAQLEQQRVHQQRQQQIQLQERQQRIHQQRELQQQRRIQQAQVDQQRVQQQRLHQQRQQQMDLQRQQQIQQQQQRVQQQRVQQQQQIQQRARVDQRRLHQQRQQQVQRQQQQVQRQQQMQQRRALDAQRRAEEEARRRAQLQAQRDRANAVRGRGRIGPRRPGQGRVIRQR